MAAPTVLRSGPAAGSTTATSANHTLAAPSVVNANETLLAIIGSFGNVRHTPPTGWVEVPEAYQFTTTSTNPMIDVFARQADGTEDGLSYTFTGLNRHWGGFILATQKLNIDVGNVVFARAQPGSSGTLTPNAVTPLIADTLLINAVFGNPVDTVDPATDQYTINKGTKVADIAGGTVTGGRRLGVAHLAATGTTSQTGVTFTGDQASSGGSATLQIGLIGAGSNAPPSVTVAERSKVYSVGDAAFLGPAVGSDADGTIASYTWTPLNGSTGWSTAAGNLGIITPGSRTFPTLNNPTSANPWFSADKPGAWTWKVEAVDNNGAVSPTPQYVSIAVGEKTQANAQMRVNGVWVPVTEIFA